MDGHGDDWELDPSEVMFQDRIASGAFGDLFRGNYCGQDVAIKVLKNVQDDSQQYREFLQVSSRIYRLDSYSELASR